MSVSQVPMKFGVEFEFIIPQAQGVDSHPEDDRFYYTKESDPRLGGDVIGSVIVGFLEDTIPIVKLEYNNYRTYQRLAKDLGINLSAGHALPYSHFWACSYEGSLQSRPEEDVRGNYNYWRHPAEISSRFLGEHEFDEVAQVYRKLRASMRINLNSSCSFHVHVGTTHLDLVGYQKLATLVFICEEFLWRCCESFRRDGPWCLSVSKYSQTACVPTSRRPSPNMSSLVPPGLLSADVRRSLLGIWASPSLRDLQEQLLVPFGRDDMEDFHHRGAFCIRDHDYRDINADLCPTATVEFRYSHASGDAERDHCFVRICIALVRAAELDGPEYTAMIASFAKGGDFSNFLGPLNLQDLHAYCNAAEREYARKAAQPMEPATEFLPRI
ncbi:hypothetical protein KVR01_006060 [Diaporthe batatas]|uniref:uncharacterized protein n=1 Tax=Diaporthe batatas TaxID=748121 RepID=UPI001D054FC5|nr:uncharacterized protein KVR01_006060 [Diaporthe batatas]KAG8164142.1 hypothetical protein KVR01_006060 [Diaporthe batatas]